MSHGDDDDWIQQVKGALDSLGLFDASMRESLIDSVREALDEVSDDGGPAITVLDGGRSRARPSPTHLSAQTLSASSMARQTALPTSR